jgi:redox-sensitive bicupin YhaK (pirin superfamily)
MTSRHSEHDQTGSEGVSIIEGKLRDLGGGFVVRRVLPSAGRQAVGPFLFFDHFGPIDVAPGAAHDVRPHPHIGIATVSYLFEGAIMHRDSLGCVQRIEPGAINWMTAGRGIVHSERTPEDLRPIAHRAHGLQLWAALPEVHEETDPAFTHYPAEGLPQVSLPGAVARVLIGRAFGVESPVKTFADTLYVDVAAQPDTAFAVDPVVEERAVYAVDGRLLIDDVPLEARAMLVLAPGAAVRVKAPDGARLVIIGGASIGKRRHMEWNFVSSRPERIEQAKRDWSAQRMGAVPGETEWIPLP